jgi:hypothetical protein
MVQMGLVAKRDDDSPEYRCSRRDPASQDPVTPCVRSYLSRDSQAIVDPTLYVNHDIENVNVGITAMSLSGAGALQRFVRGGVGLSLNAGPIMFDGLFTGGWASFRRWDSLYQTQSWRSVGTIGVEIGPAVSLAQHWYVLAHFVFDDALFRNATTPYLLGGRAAFGWTLGRTTRRKLFIEAGAILEWAGADVLGPLQMDLVNALLANGDLPTFRKDWQREQSTKFEFTWAPTLGIGYIFDE